VPKVSNNVRVPRFCLCIHNGFHDSVFLVNLSDAVLRVVAVCFGGRWKLGFVGGEKINIGSGRSKHLGYHLRSSLWWCISLWWRLEGENRGPHGLIYHRWNWLPHSAPKSFELRALLNYYSSSALSFQAESYLLHLSLMSLGRRHCEPSYRLRLYRQHI
jgi:hypothetical protein